MRQFPVIAIDGPSASGKGSVAERVAAGLGFHYLDSGAIYRAAAVAARRGGIDLTDPGAVVADLAACARAMHLRFAQGRIYLDNADVTGAVRSEEGGRDASRIAALGPLRAALLERQRAFRRAPGLVADGRDMASVVFPDAVLKVFLTADVAARARRRALQLGAPAAPAGAAKGLIEKEKDATIPPPFDVIEQAVLADLVERDKRDAGRSEAPLECQSDARLLDTTALSIEAAVGQVIGWYGEAAAGLNSKG